MLAAITENVGRGSKYMDNLSAADREQYEKTLQIYTDEFMSAYLLNPRIPSLFLENLDKQLPYITGMKFPRTSTHNGELKLCIAEFQFLWQAYYRKLNTIGVKTVQGADKLPIMHNIYCGAAPNYYAQLINSAFKSKDVFIDPNPFKVTDMPGNIKTYLGNPVVNAPVHIMWDNRKDENNNRISHQKDIVPLEDCRRIMREIVAGDRGIYIINAYMTEDMALAIAETIGQIETVNIQSDIRTNSNVAENGRGVKEPDTLDLIFNYAQTYLWIEKIRANSKFGIGLVSVKFRHPFYADLPKLEENVAKNPLIADTIRRAKELSFKDQDTGIDFLNNALAKRLIFYAAENVWLQVYCGESSTETRLITTCDKLQDYGTPEAYDNKFAMYNNIYRWLPLYKNSYACPSRGFDLCSDCAITSYCLEQYFIMIGVENIQQAIYDTLDMLKVFTHRSLFQGSHGYLFKRIPYNVLISFIENYIKQYAIASKNNKKYDAKDALPQKYKQEALVIKLSPNVSDCKPNNSTSVIGGGNYHSADIYGGYSTVLSENDRKKMGSNN